MATEERDALTEMVRQAKARGDTRLAKRLQADLDKDDCEGAVAAGAEGAEQELPIADADEAGTAGALEPGYIEPGTTVVVNAASANSGMAQQL